MEETAWYLTEYPETTLMNYILKEQHNKRIAVILNGSLAPLKTD
jgi:hypothetical protein